METYWDGAISVAVVNWNRCALLRACLQSLMAQQTDRDVEIVVVDNGSVDGSADMVETEFRDAGPFTVRLIRNRENRGFCAANNQAFAASRTEFVALLNNDAEAEPGWLAGLLEAFGRPDVGMAASRVLVYEDPGRIDKAGHLMYLDGQNRGRGSGALDNGQYDRVEEVLWPDGCAAMYRRSMLDQIGGFDEDFFAYADDAELGLRARIAGWKCLYMPAAVVRHRRGETLGLRSLRRVELIERNRVLLAAKLFPWSLLCLNGVFYMARLAAGLVAALRGRGEVGRFRGMERWKVAMALLTGDLRAIPLLPRMFRKRRQLRSIRQLSPRELRQLLWRHRITLAELSEQAI
ncbi:MAG TPA: glycosyltransferase family 2 protein [Bryobacteraceae bacterium]|nr:glycosyltransferase family 2 protein [Bryobacteraceae bacterium]